MGRDDSIEHIISEIETDKIGKRGEHIHPRRWLSIGAELLLLTVQMPLQPR